MNIIDSSNINAFQMPPNTALAGARANMRDNCVPSFTFGTPAIDVGLSDDGRFSGLPCGALHEIYAMEAEDISSAAAFTLLLAYRAYMVGGMRGARPILWARESGDAWRQGRLYPPGLVEIGINPDDILYVDARDSISVLRAAAAGLRCAALGGVIVELSGRRPKGWDLTASRRLSLSAGKSGVTIFCLRSDAAPMASAAFSRWGVASAPSTPMEANAPGHPSFSVNLLRHRGGLDGLSARLEWNRDRRCFETSPDIGGVPAVPETGTDYKNIRRRA